MRIEHGLMDGQVLQRDKRGVGRAVIHGAWPGWRTGWSAPDSECMSLPVMQW